MTLRSALHILLLVTGFSLHAQKDTTNQTDTGGLKQGYWKLYGNDSAKVLTSEGHYLNNRKNGVWTEYYSNGITKNKLTFIDGKPNGAATIYYENGAIKETGTRVNSHWVGKYKMYYESSKLMHQFIFNNKGGPVGKQISYYENGEVQCISDHSHSETSKFFYENGSIKSLNFTDSTVEFYGNGKKRSIITKNREIRYYSNGKIYSENSLVGENYNGRFNYYHENGELRYTGGYMNGKLFGQGVCYDEKGKLIDGSFVFYNLNGNKEREGQCFNGLPYGEMRVYDENGVLSAVVAFKDGKPDGPARYYKNNVLWYTEYYSNGLFLKEQTK